jgi:hypothetical protein
MLRKALQKTDFDQQEWESLYGNEIVWNGVPVYPSHEDRQLNKRKMSLTKWEDETETHYLKEGTSPPRDRHGQLVFRDGTVILTRDGEAPKMFSVSEADIELIKSLKSEHLDRVRKVTSKHNGHGPRYD